MNRRTFESGRGWRLLVVAALSGIVAACSGVRPIDYTEIHEIPPGPGLISGAAGEFELYRR